MQQAARLSKKHTWNREISVDCCIHGVRPRIGKEGEGIPLKGSRAGRLCKTEGKTEGGELSLGTIMRKGKRSIALFQFDGGRRIQNCRSQPHRRKRTQKKKKERCVHTGSHNHNLKAEAPNTSLYNHESEPIGGKIGSYKGRATVRAQYIDVKYPGNYMVGDDGGQLHREKPHQNAVTGGWGPVLGGEKDGGAAVKK